MIEDWHRHYVLSKLDTTDLTGPARGSVEDVLAEIERQPTDRFLIMARAVTGRDVSQACRDRRGVAACLLLHGVVARKQERVDQARRAFAARPNVSDRMNQAVALACLGRWREAEIAFDVAGHAYAELGDADRFKSAREMRRWCRDRALGQVRTVYVDGEIVRGS